MIEPTTTFAAPATTAVAAPTLVSVIEADASAAKTTALTWLQKHERIIIVALVLLAGTYFGDKWLNVRAAHDQQQAAIAVQQLNQQKAKDDQLSAQVSQLTAQYTNLTAQLSAQNAQLASAISNRTVVLQAQQTADKSMPLPELGNRWATLAQIAPADINASTAGITVTDTGARQTVNQLEQVPVLQQNLKDEASVADNEKQEITSANTLVSGLNTQVAGLKTEIVDGQKACTAEVASVKAAANKSKSKWFKIGFGIGFVAGFISDHMLNKL